MEQTKFFMRQRILYPKPSSTRLAAVTDRFRTLSDTFNIYLDYCFTDPDVFQNHSAVSFLYSVELFAGSCTLFI